VILAILLFDNSESHDIMFVLHLFTNIKKMSGLYRRRDEKILFR